MPQVFISYARPDETVARELERALSGANFSTFLDRHSAKGLIAGSDWLDELHGALGEPPVSCIFRVQRRPRPLGVRRSW